VALKNITEHYSSVSDLPGTLPIFPLHGALLLPGGDLPLNIFEPRYLQMVSQALAGDRLIGMIQPRDMETETDLNSAGSSGKLYEIGCAGRITSFSEGEGNQIQIILTGVCRFRIFQELKSPAPYRLVQPSFEEFAIDLTDENPSVMNERERLLESLRGFLEARSMEADWNAINTAATSTLINTLTMIGSFSASEKQALLEAPDLAHRTRTLMVLTDMSIGTTPDSSGRVLQ